MCPRRPKVEDSEDALLGVVGLLQRLGSNIRELSWETTGFEAGLRSRVGGLVGTINSVIPTETVLVLKANAQKNPIQALIIAGFCLSIGLPILCFVGFVLCAILVGLAGFVIFEGTLLTVATFILGSCLLTIGVFAGSVTIFALLAVQCINKVKATVFGGLSSILTLPNKAGVEESDSDGVGGGRGGAADNLVQSD